MTPWPLHDVAHLDLRAFIAILQSLVQAAVSRHTPLGLSARPPLEFATLCWDDTGLDASARADVTRQFNAMFHTTVPVPQRDAVCGVLAQTVFSAWEQSARPVTFFTSGSTGAPKPCTHLESHLRQEITSLAPLAAGRSAALVTAPLHHMYGFTFGLLLPLSLKIPLRSVPPLPTLVEAQMRPGDLVVGIPLLWTRLTALRGWRADAAAVRRRNITLFTATSPTPADVLAALINQGFELVDFFGASEVGAVCYRRSPEAPFTLLPHITCKNKDGVTHFARRLPDGEPRLYPIMDNITWIDERRLLPGARLDKAVQVGGINVYPGRVAAGLSAHPGVEGCLVRLMRPEEGARLKAFVVPRPGWKTDALRKDLMQYARREFTDAQRPGHYAFGPELPRNIMGKPGDW